MNIKGVLFDFNGTMFYDGELQEASWRAFLKMKIGRDVTDEEFQEYVHGINADITFLYFFEREMTKEEVDELTEDKEKVYRNLCLADKNKFKLARGLPDSKQK